MTKRQDDLDAVIKQLDAVISATAGPATPAHALGVCADLARAMKDMARMTDHHLHMGMTIPTDRAAEEAIRAAERWLIKQGWKYTPADVGTRAKEILEAMYASSLKAST